MKAEELITIIELKNKYYKKKYPNSYRLMVKSQELKKSFRLKTKGIIPLSKKKNVYIMKELY